MWCSPVDSMGFVDIHRKVCFYIIFVRKDVLPTSYCYNTKAG